LAFPAFRAFAIGREVVLSAGAGSLLVLSESHPATAYGWALVLLVAVPGAIAAAGGYGWRCLGEGAVENRAIVRAGGMVIIVLMVFGYLGLLQVPAMLVTAAVPAAVGAILVGRRSARRAVVRRRGKGDAMLRTVVVGSAATCADLLGEIKRSPGAGYDVVGWCGSSDGTDLPPGLVELGELETIERIADVVTEHRADVVLLVGDHGATAARRASWALAGTPASLVVIPLVSEIGSSRLRVRPTDDMWSLQLDVAPRRTSVPGKGAIDRVLGAVMLALAGLVLLPVLAAVRLTSPGSPLYRQQRIGIDGKPFTMWKVRSMYRDADARRAELSEVTDGNGLLFKMRSDPRVTPIGRVLRRLSIDELPQLYNVVRGDMSIVGPRPALAEETMRYQGDEPRRLAVKPGLTGLWQVSGRSDLTREESMRLDLRYVDNWSLGLDASILGRTFRAVMRGSGAY
jgi:exopolysaccharide biosynthesis polyprenyl glycosylphosphotransferase